MRLRKLSIHPQIRAKKIEGKRGVTPLELFQVSIALLAMRRRAWSLFSL